MDEQKQLQDEPIKEEILFQDKHTPLGRALGGLVIIGAGAVLLIQQLTGGYFPDWMFTWPMIPIVIGLYIGAKHQFRDFGWVIPVLIGMAFLSGRWVPGINLKAYIIPVLLIAIGLAMVLKRGRKGRRHHYIKRRIAEAESEEMGKWQKDLGQWDSRKDDFLNQTAVFGGIKKQFISKDFKGGQVTCIFGGAEIDLSHADINGVVELELTHVFGGSKLTVPSNWHIRSEITTVMGGVEDNRYLQSASIDTSKTLVLKGTCIMGGITLLSH
jgi:predicted membrane protein